MMNVSKSLHEVQIQYLRNKADEQKQFLIIEGKELYKCIQVSA